MYYGSHKSASTETLVLLSQSKQFHQLSRSCLQHLYTVNITTSCYYLPGTNSPEYGYDGPQGSLLKDVMLPVIDSPWHMTHTTIVHNSITNVITW